jgi:hypothetical protein
VAGARYDVGGVALPYPPLYPQQATVPSFFTPHLWNTPTLTLMKLPAGGVAEPNPQQVTVPSVLTAQL